MFIAHLPAGFLLTHTLIRSRQGNDPKQQLTLFVIGMLGSVAPDFDLIYFYLVDHGYRSHHYFWPHLPVFLSVIYCVLWLTAIAFKRRELVLAVHVFCLNTLLHCVLDTTAGGIRWLYPWDDHFFRLFTVPARQSYWVMNFIWHWSFMLELLIISIAARVAYRHYGQFIPRLRGMT